MGLKPGLSVCLIGTIYLHMAMVQSRGEIQNTDLKSEIEYLRQELRLEQEQHKQVLSALSQVCKVLDGTSHNDSAIISPEEVLSALSQVCKVLDGTSHNDSAIISPEECNISENKLNKHLQIEDSTACYNGVRPNKVIPNPQSTEFDIQILALKADASDKSTNTITVTVEYTASTQPNAWWWFKLDLDQHYQTGGWTKYHKSRKMFSSGITLDNQLLNSSYMSMGLFTERDGISIKVKTSSLLQPLVEVLQPLDLRIDGLSLPVEAPTEENLNISFNVKGNTSTIESVYAALFGFNTSVTPSEAIYTTTRWSGTANEKTLLTTDESSKGIHVELSIPALHSRHGGKLSLQLYLKSNNLIRLFHYFKVYDVVSSKTGTVFPSGSLYVRELPKQTYITSQYQTISCTGNGNPRPDVALFKHGSTDEQLKQDSEISYALSITKAFTIFANDSNVEGKYYCRAWHIDNPEYSMKTATEVTVYIPTEIDISATGVIRNESNKVEISCQATGNPIPKLKLRLYYDDGPDLASSSRYKVTRTELDNKRTRLVVTMSPVDTDIYLVYCWASDSLRYPYTDKGISSEIRVFPEPETGKNYELYHKLMLEQKSKRDLSHMPPAKPKFGWSFT